MCVTVIKTVNNVVPAERRVLIRDYLISVHMVLFICNISMVVFEP